jgi:hypothetical protein
LTIRARETSYLRVADFYSGQNIDTPGKRALWDAAMNLRGGPECTLKVFEKRGRRGLHLRGIREFLKNNIDPDDLIAEAALRIQGNYSPETRQKILLSNMVSNLANQFRTKFEPIYHMMTNTTARIVDPDAFLELNDHFKTASAATDVTVDRALGFELIAEIYKRTGTDESTRAFIKSQI